MTTTTFRVLSKFYRLLLIIVSFFMLVIVGAGSHGGISLQNKQTLFAFASISAFVLTAITITFFLWNTAKWRRPKGVALILLSSISTIFSLLTLIKLLAINLDRSSGWTYISVLSLSMLIVLGLVIVRKASTLN
jgi:hypothetical protein